MLLAHDRYGLFIQKLSQSLFTLIFFISCLIPAANLECGAYEDIRDLSKLNKLVSKLKKLCSNHNIFEIISTVRELKDFADKKCNRKIAYEELRQCFFENVEKLGLHIEKSDFQPFYELITGVKSKNPHEERAEELPFDLIVGMTMLFCCPLVFAIGYAWPASLPVTLPLSNYLLKEGKDYLIEGLRQKNEMNKKNKG